MTTTTTFEEGPAVEPHTFLEPSYLTSENTLSSWLFTRDHKRIALMFFASITVFFFVGGGAATLMRMNLATPHGLLQPSLYNRMFTMHGIIMVWFFLIPSIPTTFGNFFIPMMIGARDLAFPRVNLLSWYVFNLSGFIVLYSLIMGGADTGWTFYTPLSTVYADGYVFAAAMAVFINGFSSIMTALNFVVTIHRLRAPGMTWTRLPLFVWGIYAVSVVMLTATPVLAMDTFLLAVERFIGIGLFDPRHGGDPLLWQHMFWFYSHPAVYIMILPAMGVVSEIIPCYARRPVFGYTGMTIALMAIAILSFFVWAHHMFVAGISVYSGVAFSLLTFFVAVPSAIKVFNWTVSLHKGRISFDAPMLYALGFVLLFTLGGITGLMLATLAIDVDVHGTYFVIAHFHYIMVGATVSAFFGALHYWWPKMTGRLYPEMWARFAAILTYVGFNLTFFPQFVLGYLGMPRRSYTYPPEWQSWNLLSSAGASILAVAYLLPLFYLGWSLFWGRKAGANPWGATGLEWITPSPPTKHNFERTPVVTLGPYSYDPDEDSFITQEGVRHVR
ncbi:cbb3-type cytochrome c oxidase subunit I [Bradyrhizobium sp.]|uniref:cytochrome c oxidase subunit I n=1 Tax=Bradyrhizobium sp. TaxID=376 RepID=UPI00239A5179|nr:cbb3-type cytochrome c oxidase subunit I [Bradyrhizobium sp.]MDE1932814.1 cbb3-type cytochrome c oxidase subunit I [Bradyrhizobium sp.]